MTSLSVNDAVTVTKEGGGTLEGVIAYLGSVQFDSDKDAWMGIRLTGSSVGQGNHDGTVKGVTYFTCPAQCGMFVRANQVQKRNLTRLEELRLRRELASSSTTTASTAATPAKAAAATTTTTSPSSNVSSPSSSAAAATTPAASSSRIPTTPATTTTPATSSSAIGTGLIPSSSSAATRSKLEELRLRRAALKEAQQASSGASVSGTTPSTTPAVSRASTPTPLEAATSTITTAATSTTATTGSVSSLTAQLQASQQETAELQAKLKTMQQKITLLENQVKTSSPARTKPSSTTVITEEGREQILQLQSANCDLQDSLEAALQEVADLRKTVERERQGQQQAQEQLTRAKAEAAAYASELQTVADQSAQRGAADASHYKERAKLQAEQGALKRKLEQMEAEKVQLENNLEDVTLDKEQLLEEKEALEDRCEELRIDAETAQMEVEELRMELEDARAATERALTAQAATAAASSFHKASGASAEAATALATTGSMDLEGLSMPTEAAATAGGTTSRSGSGGGGGDAEEMMQALTVQNARLREAILRLREQTAVEKMEWTRQLRAAEKEAAAGQEVAKQVQALKTAKMTLEEQVNDLKDMVEQGSAFESMVEDLSDRVLSLEEDVVVLQSTIREMEEAAELTAEMEEVQTEELKALGRDLESRDTVIRNLEEAIKMQRRREEDFRRTVGNYRTTVETLKHEKQALLELQQGGEGEKSDLIASSQKALSRAAQLVADAAEVRKREATAVMDHIDCQVYKHLSARLESLLPQSVAVAEVSAIKGEMLAAKVVGMAAQSLQGITVSFGKTIRPILDPQQQPGGADESPSSLAPLDDELQQKVKTMFHQTDFAHVISDLSSELIRFLMAGQWPDFLTLDASTEIGSLLGHSVSDLDNVLGSVLKSLKEEGFLTQEQSNIGALQQTLQSTMHSLRSDIEREDGTLVPASWNPPGWQLLHDASCAKFSTLGTAAALSAVLQNQADGDAEKIPVKIRNLYGKLEQSSTQASTLCLRLANLDVKNDKVVDELSTLMASLKKESDTLVEAMQKHLLGDGPLEACEVAVQAILSHLAKVSAALRSANMHHLPASTGSATGGPSDDAAFHAMSPEVQDAWEKIASLARSVRSIDGDAEDVHYAHRARDLEHRLTEAVDNEPKLAIANTKVASLEKNLASRSKEIAMQNARLSELEKILAKSSADLRGRSRSVDMKSSEEFNSLKEENRVLMEAMDVLHRQVEEYESEIRILKDFKSPKRGAAGGRTPRRGFADLSAGRGAAEEAQTSTGSLEATLFRPALQNALAEAAKWKAATTTAGILELPPLQPPSNWKREEAANEWTQLNAAISACRLQKASSTLVDLTDRTKTPRQQLRENIARSRAVADRLDTVVLQCQGRAL